jgi:predicted MFS family arabinose efflux permease
MMNTAFSREQRILLWLACSAIFFEAFDVSIVNLALPVIAADLHIALATAQWIQTIYLLTFGGFLLLGGRLCDHYGSAVIFITGMSLFGCASALGYFSRDIVLLLPARAGQGIGAALAMPAGISLLSRYFGGEQQQGAFGIFGAFAAVGFAGGLAIGGMIATLLDWHWIFGVNVPVIAAVVVVAWRYIPRVPRPGPELAGADAGAGDARPTLTDATDAGDARPNGWIAAWLTATVLVLSGAVHEAARLGWVTLPCVAGALLSGLFLLRVDRRLRRPFFGAGVYRSREAYRGLAAFSLLGAGFLPFVFTCTLSLGICLGQGILSTGLWLFPYSIGSALVSKYLLPRLYRRMQPQQVGLLAMILLLAGDVLLAGGIVSRQAGWFLGALLLVNSLSIAIGYPAFTVLSLAGVAPEKQGVAAGIQSTLYTVASGLGLSFISLSLDALGSGRTALLTCCGIVAAMCISALVICMLPKRPSPTRENG